MTSSFAQSASWNRKMVPELGTHRASTNADQDINRWAIYRRCQERHLIAQCDVTVIQAPNLYVLLCSAPAQCHMHIIIISPHVFPASLLSKIVSISSIIHCRAFQAECVDDESCTWQKLTSSSSTASCRRAVTAATTAAASQRIIIWKNKDTG